jgi:glycosyltransferase involved in cell wall biosynthesis
VDNSLRNYVEKRDLFNSVGKMELITHSQWLGDLVKKSFLKNYVVHLTPSAINLDLFKPLESDLRLRYSLGRKKVILGCASIWSNRKGYQDFVELSKKLYNDYLIVMIGLKKNELKSLPGNIIGLERTESIHELAQWYSLAHVFVNPTSQDNFPTANLEALACGTPVITYNTGGSPESIDEQTGVVVDKGSITGILNAIEEIESRDYSILSKACRKRAERLFDKKTRYLDYLNIFQELLANKHVKN